MSGTQKRSLVDDIRKTFFGDCGLDFLDVARLKTNEAFLPLAEAIAAKFTAEQLTFAASFAPHQTETSRP